MATATQKDYYEILGVPRDASSEQMRKAYLKLAHRYHPDKTGGDKAAEEKLKRINEAYDTLKNEEKRKQYDVRGAQYASFADDAGAWSGAGPFTQESHGFDFSNGGAAESFEDIFGSILGGRASRAYTAVQLGDDIEVALTLSLREAVSGTTKRIRIPRRETCSECKGSGAAPGTAPEVCSACGGRGHVGQTHGAFSISQTCPKCGGAGRRITRFCPACEGRGSIRTERDLSVTVPAGVTTGGRLRLAGEGDPGANGGPRGDLYVHVAVAPDEFFTREGDDLICEVPVPFTTAALGDKVRVPTLDGVADLTIPAGTQQGTLFRMRGVGVPRPNGAGKGDEIVRVIVEVPTKLSRHQRELLAQMAGPDSHVNYPLYRRFLDKVLGTRPV